MSSKIVLIDVHDIAFSKIAQGAIVTGAIFPSGLQVPKTGRWIIQQDTLVDITRAATFPGSPHTPRGRTAEPSPCPCPRGTRGMTFS